MGRMEQLDERQYRHEQKYICGKQRMESLKTAIKGLLQYDSHTDQQGQYNVRSLYFDDRYNTEWYNNENGNDPRAKYRIRIYNHQTDMIRLERKIKRRGKTLKESCRIEKAVCEEIISTGRIPRMEAMPQLYQRFFAGASAVQLSPKIIVDYDRTVFTGRFGNVRITFDENISSALNIQDFFNDAIARRPIMPLGQGILEVKYDEYLPDTVYRILQTGELRETAFSKYYYCRKYANGFQII